ncbi:hypothetical protein, partial [Salinispora arenicola]|uniref:hypothetical protein n=1 Tax=Salinispora arenicola TaxID=168697 RepID=UPI0027DDCC0D
ARRGAWRFLVGAYRLGGPGGPVALQLGHPLRGVRVRRTSCSCGRAGRDGVLTRRTATAMARE